MMGILSVKKLLTLSVIVYFLIQTASVTAAEGDYRYGVLDSVQHENTALVIDDNYLPMALNLKVIDHRGKSVNRYSLIKGQKLKYLVGGGIMEIWILPNDFVFPVVNDTEEAR